MTTADSLNYQELSEAIGTGNTPAQSKGDMINAEFEAIIAHVVAVKSKFSSLAFRLAGIDTVRGSQNKQDDSVCFALRWDEHRKEYVSLVDLSVLGNGILKNKIDNLVNFVFPMLKSDVNLELKKSIIKKVIESFKESQKDGDEDSEQERLRRTDQRLGAK
ncbi:hypothetical protein B0H34DRAFT_136362 [Crassisporium funariophilum]|nr:hypothetical protein B0H34DRAFT_136362 [Crassisporium funariophilum]